MSSRAVRQFRARNPNQHQLLTGLVVDRQMSLLERGAKPYMRGASPGIVEDGEGEERGRARRRTRGGKTVTWSKTLLQVSPNSHNKRDIVYWFLHSQHYMELVSHFYPFKVYSYTGSQHQPSSTSTSSLASSSTSISFTLDVFTSIGFITSLVIVATLPNEIAIAAGNSDAVKQWHSATTLPLATSQCSGTPSPPSAAPAAKKPQPEH